MRSTFFGLNIGLKGLLAQQRALDVTSHNVANANTPGYSRQDVITKAALPVRTADGFIGTGVEIAEIRRIRDQFIDMQIRSENKALGQWEVRSDILSRLEGIMNEPTEYGLGSVLSEYWNEWQELSKNPESAAIRQVVVQKGIVLTETFNHIGSQLSSLQQDINKTIEIKVDQINSIARQLKDLNIQIVKAENGGPKANDLRDKRDLLVEQLSKMVDIDCVEDSSGSVNVTVGGRSLVMGSYHWELKFTDDLLEPTAATIEWIDPYTQLVQGNAVIKSGELKAYLIARDEDIVDLESKLSDLAERIATEVNILHQSGYDLDDNPGLEFFVKIEDGERFSINNIQINRQLIDDLNKLAAGQATPVMQGDGSNALAIAQLRNMSLMNPKIFTPPVSVTGAALSTPVDIVAGDNDKLALTINGVTKIITIGAGSYPLPPGVPDLVAELQNKLDAAFGAGVVSASLSGSNELVITSLTGPDRGVYDISGPAASTLGLESSYKVTFDDYFRSAMAELGIMAQEAEWMRDNQTLLTENLINRKDSISSVSLDEEMANMIKYQHSYTACARVINAMDEMLDLIVNRLGVVGR